jgi:hypothetical protein
VRNSLFSGMLLFAIAIVAMAQTALTNDTIIKMAKAGLSDDVIVSTISSQPARFSTTADDLISLKGAGISDKVIGAMVTKGAGAPTPSAPAPSVPPSAAPALGYPTEVGVYYLKGDQWADLHPEVVNFKTGGVLKSIGTAGIMKGDVNGHVNGEHSTTQLKTPVTLLVYVHEGVDITEYQLLRLRESKDAREFRTVTGGVMHVSGGATRDLMTFEGKKVAPRTYQVLLPTISSGDFGLLPPAGADATSSSGRIGKVYSFRIIE